MRTIVLDENGLKKDNEVMDKDQKVYVGPVEQTPPSSEAEKADKVLDDYINS